MPEIIFPSEWLKIGVNVEEGDHIKFMDVGEFDAEKGNWTFNVGVFRNGAVIETKKFTLNKTNFNAVKEVYGGNSDNWLMKNMKVSKIKTRNPQTGLLVDAVALSKPDVTE